MAAGGCAGHCRLLGHRRGLTASKPSASRMTPTADEVSAMPSGASMKDVIVADNDYIVRGILRSILEREGFTVLQAVDGLEAIEYAMRVRAQLVILDYKMPKLDGFGACAQIRHLPGYADTPIAVLTAFDNEDTRTTAERAGVTTVMAKPFKPVDL